MGTYKTPGVYIVEKKAFPNSVVEVETAVPAFVGYTEKADDGSQSLLNKPFRISSMSEFDAYFGGANNNVKYTVTSKEEANASKDDLIFNNGTDKKYYAVTTDNTLFMLYYCMKMFFANGGGPCFIVSVGNYTDKVAVETITAGIDLLKEEREATMLLVPDAMALDAKEYANIQTAMLSHCGEMQNRVTLLDFKYEKDADIVTFRDGVGSSYLSYGAAYHPWLNTSVLSERDVTDSFLSDGSLDEILSDSGISREDLGNDKSAWHNILYQNSLLYKAVITEIRRQLNLLPPAAAMAGIYTAVDNARGVWKAPANISVNNVISLSHTITNDDQELLNVPLNGKSINAIRFFTGDGIKVWGARTLDGNSLDWRYINVRRTMIFLEESVRNAARVYVFEPNVASTWLNMKGMIENFLRGIWKRGGLAGASPEDAYSVHVGLGDTMSAQDILDGILRITVLVAISHPAEFIEITFQQQMQKS